MSDNIFEVNTTKMILEVCWEGIEQRRFEYFGGFWWFAINVLKLHLVEKHTSIAGSDRKVVQLLQLILEFKFV
jgi:hypothetical protein